MTKTKEGKICPFITGRSCLSDKDKSSMYQDEITFCFEESCALWNAKNQCCGLIRITD